MNNTDKMLCLLRQLMRHKNGIVVDSMRGLGIEYPMSYGVDIPTIKKIAKEHETDHKLAKYLYRQDIRELKLASLSIADPKMVDSAEIGFWAEGVVNSEVAEQLAAILLYDTDVVTEILDRWLDCDNEKLQYCALLSAARRLMVDENSPRLDLDKTFQKLLYIVNTDNRDVWTGVARLISMLSRHYPDIQERSFELLETAKESGLDATSYLKEEFETVWFSE